MNQFADYLVNGVRIRVVTNKRWIHVTKLKEIKNGIEHWEALECEPDGGPSMGVWSTRQEK
jgi:hypothetical protein